MSRYALVIGISQYSLPLNTLPTPTNDAETIAKILETYGDFRVTRFPYWRNPKNNNQVEMVDKKVEGNELRKIIINFLLEQAKDSEAIIYFTGHGVQVLPYEGLDPKGYLVPSNHQFTIKNNRIVEQINCIPFSEINEIIYKSNVSNLVVILDCCHSGEFIERELIQRSFTFSAKQDYYLIAGCRSHEEGKIIKGESHSVFTGALIKALSEENADSRGSISGDRLFDSISRELNKEVQEPIRLGWGKSIQILTYPLKNQDPKNIEIPLNRSNPYLGLKSFESSEAKLFHGREKAVRELLDRLNNSRFLAVIGASGCGKSSLVKAGLLPILKNNYFPGSGNWEVEIFTPGNNPLYNLNERLDNHTDNQPYILFIDQFEEIFTLTQNEEERKRFIKKIADEVQNPEKQTRVIIAMRGDFLDKCAEYVDAANLINQDQVTSYLVQPLSVTELEQAIEEPAKLHGVTFESGLVSKIIDDVARQPGALPLMQYALKELWDICIKDESSNNKQLNFAGYQKIGEVKGALEKTADRFYQCLNSEDEKKFIQRLFTMELVHLGEGKEVTRKRADRKILTKITGSEPQLDHLINRLAETRLIVITDKTVEVSHEALFTHWSSLKEWIEENRYYIRLRQKLKSDCRAWREDYNKSDDALLTGAILANIEEWKNKTLEKFSDEEEEYIRRSIETRDKELQEKTAKIERELEQERKLKKFAQIQTQMVKYEKKLIIITSGLLIFSAFSGLFSYIINEQKKQEKFYSLGTLVTQAKSDFYDKHDQLGALMTSIKVLDKLEKINLDKDKKTEIRDDIKTIVYEVKEQNRLEGHRDEVWNFSIHPDGQKIVSGSFDKTIRLWNINGKLLDKKEQEYPVGTIEFDHKGKIIASASSTTMSPSIRLWEIHNDKLIRINDNIIPGLNLEKQIYDLVFNHDDQMIAFSSLDGNLRLLRRWRSQIEIQQVSCQDKSPIYKIDFHPQKDIIAYGCNEGIYIWEINKLSPKLITNSQHKEIISTVRFSHVRNNILILASASNDGNIKLWDVSHNYKQIGEIRPKKSLYLDQISFDSQNKFIASSHQDINAGIRIWSLDKAIQSYPQLLEYPENYNLIAHTNSVNEINFHTIDPSMIISASSDSSIRIWSLKPKFNHPSELSTINLLKQSCNFLNNFLNLNKNKIQFQETKEICHN